MSNALRWLVAISLLLATFVSYGTGYYRGAEQAHARLFAECLGAIDLGIKAAQSRKAP